MTSDAARIVSQPRGALIAFEGIDGSGKSHQAELLRQWLETEKIANAMFTEPTKGPIGQDIRRLAHAGRLDPQAEFHLFLEDRQEDVDKNIRPALLSGKVVVMDRYYISSMAYQGARGIDTRMIQLANERIAPRPDLIFLLDVDVDEALKRIHVREEEGPNLFEQADYLKKVQKIFDGLTWEEIRHIDGLRDVETIQAEIRRETETILREKGIMK